MIDIASLVVRARAEGVAKVQAQLAGLNTEAKKTSKALLGIDKGLSRTAANVAKFIGITTLGVALNTATKTAIEFEQAMAEVSTLTNSMDMSRLESQLISISEQFGANKTTQARALYQVISAGASTAAEATQTLVVANKLAVGGVTDVATAADGLTSAINAYGLSAEYAESISDAMFTAMKAGKTTIGELSQNVGKLAPIAAQAGVSFEEMMAATAAVTKTGLDTSMTMNSLRQVIVSVLKPSKEAADTAKELGLEFGAAALQSQGLAQFLENVRSATGGNVETMTKLFGSVEALQSVLHLTSTAGGAEFANILGQMDEKAGATNEAFDKMSQTFGFLWGVLREKLHTQLLNTGTTLMEVLTPALIWTTENFDLLIASAKTFAQIVLVGALAKALIALPGMLVSVATYTAGVTAAIWGLTAAVLANPLGLLVVGITAAVAALTIFKDKQIEIGGTTAKVSEWVAASWEWLGQKTEKYTAWMSKSFETFFTFLQDHVFVIPTAFDGMWDNIVAGAKAGTNTIIRLFHLVGKSIGIVMGAAVDYVVWFGTKVLEVFDGTWAGIQALLSGRLDFSQLKDALTVDVGGAASELASRFSDAWNEVSGRDYLGDISDSARRVVSEIAAIVQENQKLASTSEDALGTTIPNNADKAADAMSSGTTETKKWGQSIEDMGLTAQKTSTVFKDAMVHAVERVDQAFVDMWKGIGDGWDDLVKSIKSSFSQLLAELAHAAITRPIVMNIVASATGMKVQGGNLVSGGTSLMQDIGGAGGLLPWMKGGLQGIFGAGGTLNSIYSSTGQFLRDIGLTGLGDQATLAGNMMYGNSSAWMNAANLGLNVGAGFLGNYAGQQVFGGNTTGIGSAAGGFVGSIAGGPIGTAIGSFLGEGLETALGNVLGFGGTSNNRVYADITGGRVGADYVTDNGRHKEQRDAVQAISPIIQAMIDAVGGTEFEGTISASAKHGLELNKDEIRTKDAEQFLGEIWDRVLDGATHLDKNLKSLIESFEGTTEETLMYADALLGAFGPDGEVSDNLMAFLENFKGTAEELYQYASDLSALNEMISVNPVKEAFIGFTQGMDAANTTMTAFYDRQVSNVAKLIASYDGSAESTRNLTSAYASMQVMAAQLATAIMAAHNQIDSITKASAESIRESVMTEKELFYKWRDERDALAIALQSMTDPGQIQDTVSKITALNKQMWDSLSDEQRLAESEKYATYIEDINEMGKTQLEAALRLISDEQEAMNITMEDALKTAAMNLQGASELFGVHVSQFENVVGNLDRIITLLQRNGIPVEVELTGIAAGGERGY